MNKYFKYINDDIFYNNVDEVIKKYIEKSESFSEKTIFKNKLDPFHIFIQSSISENNASAAFEVEKQRQLSKTLSNLIGKMHEKNIQALEGFEKIPEKTVTTIGATQVDAINHNRKIVVEVKNKWNTVKGSDKKSIFDGLKAHVQNGFKGYYLIINHKKTVDNNWDFNNKGDHYKDNDIFEISIDRFLEKITGDSNSFDMYIKAFMEAVNDSLYVLKNRRIQDDVLEEFNSLIFSKNYEEYK